VECQATHNLTICTSISSLLATEPPVVAINVAIAIAVDGIGATEPPVVAINVTVAIPVNAIASIAATEPPVVAINVTVAVPVNAIASIAAVLPSIVVVNTTSLSHLRTSRAAAVHTAVTRVVAVHEFGTFVLLTLSATLAGRRRRPLTLSLADNDRGRHDRKRQHRKPDTWAKQPLHGAK